MSCVYFITHVFIVPWEYQSFPRAHGNFHSSCQSQPPLPTWALRPTSPRTLSLALGQALGLFMNFYLRVCTLALCTQEISSWLHQSTHKHLSLSEQEENSRSDKQSLKPTPPSWVAVWPSALLQLVHSFGSVPDLWWKSRKHSGIRSNIFLKTDELISELVLLTCFSFGGKSVSKMVGTSYSL